LSESLKYFYLS